MGLAVVTVPSGGLPIVEATAGTPVTEATNGRGVAVTKVVGRPGMPVRFETIGHASLPTGVTLQGIDGGPSYYGNSGWTYAANAGWDNPSFFPIGLWFAPIRFQSDADRWLDLGLNTMFVFTTDTLLSLLRTNGIWAIPSAVPSELGAIIALNGSLGSESVGLLVNDEPTTTAEATNNIAGTAAAHQAGRFWWENFLPHWIGLRDINGVYNQGGNWGALNNAQLLNLPITIPGGSSRHIDIASHDAYWVGNAVANNYNSSFMYGDVGALTADEIRRPCHYGDMLNQMRIINTQAGRSVPIFQVVENGGPYTAQTTAASYIRPAELNAAVWSAIMNGARGIQYFNHSFAGPGQSFDNLAAAYYQTIQSGETISIYNQTKQTNALVKQLAPVINSSFANGYVTVSPAPGQYTNFFGEHPRNFTGFDAVAKYSSGQFYIFAMPRHSPSLSNQTATFTIAASTPAATTATVINEARTRPITGGTTFTDTFATAHTVHIYRID